MQSLDIPPYLRYNYNQTIMDSYHFRALSIYNI